MLACVDPALLDQFESQMATMEAFNEQFGKILTPVSDLTIVPGEKAGQVVVSWMHPMGEEVNYELYISDNPINDENWRQIQEVPIGENEITYSNVDGSWRMTFTWDGLPIRRKYWLVVRQTLEGLETLGNAVDLLGPVMGIDIPEYLWTIPPSELATSNQVSIIDTGIRPDPNGFKFENFIPRYHENRISWRDYLEVLRFVYGDQDVCVSVDNGKCKPRKSAKQSAKKSIKGAQCFGFTTTSGLFFLDKLEQRDFMGVGPFLSHDTIDINSNELILNEIMAYHKLQNHRWVYEPIVDTNNMKLADNIQAMERDILTASRIPNVTVTNDTRKCPGHSVLPFFLSSHDAGIIKIWVYDNNHSRDYSRFIEANTLNDQWVYRFSDNKTWSGKNINDQNVCGKLGHSEISIYGSIENGDYHGLAPWTVSNFEIIASSTDSLLIISESGRRLGLNSSGQFINEIPGAVMNVLDETGQVAISLPNDTYQYLIKDVDSLDDEFLVFGGNQAFVFESLSLGDEFSVSETGIHYSNQKQQGSPKISVALERPSESLMVSYQAEVSINQPINIDYSFDSFQVFNVFPESVTYMIGIEYVSSSKEFSFQNEGNHLGANDSIIFQPKEFNTEEEILFIEIDTGSDGVINEIISLENQYVPQDDEEDQSSNAFSSCPEIFISIFVLFIVVLIVFLITKNRKKKQQEQYSSDDFFNF